MQEARREGVIAVGRLLAIHLAVAASCVAAASRAAAQAESPFTRLFDTGAPSSVPLPAQALGKRAGWSVVPEGKLAHKFAGDAAFLNDKLAVVLRKNGPGVEVYSKTPSGLRRRATLIPRSATAGLTAIRTIENSPAAVMLEAVFGTDGGKGASARFRLTTGETILEARPGEGARRLLIRSNTRYVVVPDFFADDMVFGADTVDGSRVGLPAENFVLNLVEGGDAIVMCVWQSNQQNADVLLAGEGRERAVSGVEIECMKGKSIWVAFLEGPRLWHSRRFSDEDKKRDIALAWKPPFPAKWRVSLVREDGVADSWQFGQEGKARRVTGKHGGPLVVYPLDRSRATPLTVFCPIDVMRNTLGVGPCQYILAMEGLGSEAPATPDLATRWIEKQFKRKRDKRYAAEIKERLDQMAHHIQRAEARIEQYGEFARRVRKLCAKEERNEDVADVARELRGLATGLDLIIHLGREPLETSRSARRLTGAMAALIGRKDALAECQRLGAQLRAIGADQDRTLARCRMAVRRLKQQCRMIAARGSQAAGLARKVQSQAEQMLRKKK